MLGVLNKYGATTRVSPWLAGSAPFHQFTRTLGLPFVRTSPDHGTAFNIAGTGLADPGPTIAAIAMAATLALTRKA